MEGAAQSKKHLPPFLCAVVSVGMRVCELAKAFDVTCLLLCVCLSSVCMPRIVCLHISLYLYLRESVRVRERDTDSQKEKRLMHGQEEGVERAKTSSHEIDSNGWDCQSMRSSQETACWYPSRGSAGTGRE